MFTVIAENQYTKNKFSRDEIICLETNKQTNKNLNEIMFFVVFLFGLGGVFWGVLKTDNQICNKEVNSKRAVSPFGILSGLGLSKNVGVYNQLGVDEV